MRRPFVRDAARPHPFLDHAQLTNASYEADPEVAPPVALTALAAMLTPDPALRTSLAELLATPWLAAHRREGVACARPDGEPDSRLLATVEAKFGAPRSLAARG